MNIGFISTRFAGTDGVSLETEKMAAVLGRLGHESFYCAGELDPQLPGLEDPALHFEDAQAREFTARAFAGSGRDDRLLAAIEERALALERPLRDFLARYQIDYVIVQNALAIPMQLSLAKAITHVVRDSGLPALAHNHDLYWERPRYATHTLGDFLDNYFPPDWPQLRHAVINSLAAASLKARRGLDSVLLPNVMDFAAPAPGVDEFNADFRVAIGLSDDDWLILQPTRVIPRKGIELSLDLLAALDDPRAVLVITHKAGDEGLDYLHGLERDARARGLRLLNVADRVDAQRGVEPGGAKTYSLWDAYPHADLVTYPSLIEGFGNALLETIYFRVPALVNRYEVYAADIGPLGFEFAEIDGALTGTAVAQTRAWLETPASARAAVDHNYQLAARHFSYETLAERLAPLLPA